jgi:hypothetical protein
MNPFSPCLSAPRTQLSASSPRIPATSLRPSDAHCCQPGFPIWIDCRPRDRVHRAGRPVGQLVHVSQHLNGSHSGEPQGLCEPLPPSVIAATTSSKDTAATALLAAHPRRPRAIAPAHVGCHASRSMRRRIWPNRRAVKWLSASCRTKYRACQTRRSQRDRVCDNRQDRRSEHMAFDSSCCRPMRYAPIAVSVSATRLVPAKHQGRSHSGTAGGRRAIRWPCPTAGSSLDAWRRAPERSVRARRIRRPN